MKIALGTIFYNNKLDLERQIKSIPDDCGITHYFGIDGIFNYNFGKDGNDSGISNDGSHEVLDSLLDKGIKCHISYRANQTEFDKRNRYLELCEKYNIDILIIIDSDELFYYPGGKDPLTQWQKFREEMAKLIKMNRGHNVYGIKTILSDDYSLMEYFRVWVNPGEMRYFRNSHYHYLNIKNGEYESQKDQTIMQTQQALGTVTSLMLRHNHSLRTHEQMQQRREYQHYLINYELLVQKNTPPDTADQIAKMYPYPPPSKTIENVDTCPCDHCAPIKPNYDPSKIIKRKF